RVGRGRRSRGHGAYLRETGVRTSWRRPHVPTGDRGAYLQETPRVPTGDEFQYKSLLHNKLCILDCKEDCKEDTTHRVVFVGHTASGRKGDPPWSPIP